MLPRLKLKNCLSIILGSAILAFGLYNIHSISGVTEGGVLGLTLLLEHWFGISPSISGLVLNGACYALGLTLLGREFIFYSFIAGGGFSLFYAIFERFPPLWPQIAQMPLAASVAGAAFVGVGVGLCIPRKRRPDRRRFACAQPFASFQDRHPVGVSSRRHHRSRAVADLHPL